MTSPSAARMPRRTASPMPRFAPRSTRALDTCGNTSLSSTKRISEFGGSTRVRRATNASSAGSLYEGTTIDTFVMPSAFCFLLSAFRSSRAREHAAPAHEIGRRLFEAVHPAAHLRQLVAAQHLVDRLLCKIPADVLFVVARAEENARAARRDVQMLQRTRADVVAARERTPVRRGLEADVEPARAIHHYVLLDFEAAAGVAVADLFEVARVHGVTGAQDDDLHLIGKWAVLHVVDVTQHDAQMIRAARLAITLLIQCRKIDAQVPERPRLDQRLGLQRRESRSVAQHRHRQSRGEQRAAMLDEAPLHARLVVTLQEHALQRVAIPDQLADDVLEERVRHRVVLTRIDRHGTEVTALIARRRRFQRHDLQSMTPRPIVAVAHEPAVADERFVRFAAPLERAEALVRPITRHERAIRQRIGDALRVDVEE